MWELWKRSQSLRVRPSDLVGIRGSVKAFYFDRGIWRFGNNVEVAVDAAEQQARKTRGKKSKVNEAMVSLARQQTLDKMLKIDPVKTKGRFKDPALNFKGPSKGKSGGQDKPIRDAEDLGVGFLG